MEHQLRLSFRRIDFGGCEIVTPDAANLLSQIKEHHQFQVDGRVLVRLAHRAPPVSFFGFWELDQEGIRRELAF